MLQKLIIKNFALIDELEINFQSAFNVITGETGAGKSIILGALGLLLGERNDSKTHNDPSKKCIIEGQFQIKNYDLKNFFDERELDYEDLCIVRREISADNKSRAFINDSPCTIQTLKALGELLVDIHSQHETILLNSSAYQLNLIDSVSNTKKDVIEFSKNYSIYTTSLKELEQLENNYTNALKELDYIQFQFNELSQYNFKSGEQESLEQEQSVLSNADEIQQKIVLLNQMLVDGESNFAEQLKYAISNLSSIEKHNDKLKVLNDRLRSLLIEIKDIHAELESVSLESVADPKRLEIIQDRLDIIYRLEQKHRVESVDELLVIQSELDEKLNNFSSSEELIQTKKVYLEKLKNELLINARLLSENRSKSFELIKKHIVDNLKDLGIPNAQIEIEHQQNEEAMNKFGIDDIRILFSANKGQKPEYIHKVASGGELSRLMLCIKSLLAEKEQLPTIIFDEIDTGVSGEVANKMGQIMRKLSASLQVISITHLPQIASLGNHHYFVYKEHTEKESLTKLKELSKDDRVIEIAKMLSGDNPSSGAIENAKELLSY